MQLATVARDVHSQVLLELFNERAAQDMPFDLVAAIGPHLPALTDIGFRTVKVVLDRLDSARGRLGYGPQSGADGDRYEIEAKANENLQKTALEIAHVVKKGFDSGMLSEAHVKATKASVSFDLYATNVVKIASASTNDDLLKVLAGLVVHRMAVTDGDIVSINVTLATEALEKVTPRHLQILAFLKFIHYYNLTPEASEINDRVVELTRDLETEFKRFAGFTYPTSLELGHLESISLLTLSDERTREIFGAILSRLTSSVVEAIGIERANNIPTFQWLAEMEMWDPKKPQLGLSHVHLTPVGYMLGSHVLDAMRGDQTDYRSWYETKETE